MWIFTGAVLCDGPESAQEYLMRGLLSIMQSVNWVCEEALEGHEWVSELTIIMQENGILVALKYEIDVPCVVRCGLLWFSSLSRLNQRFEGNGTTIAKYHELIDLAIVASFMRSVAAVLDRAQTKIGMWAGRRLVGDSASGLCSCLMKMIVEPMCQMNEGARNS